MSDLITNHNGIVYRFPDYPEDDTPFGFMNVRYEMYSNGRFTEMHRVFVKGTNLADAYILINGWNFANALQGFVCIISSIVLPKFNIDVAPKLG